MFATPHWAASATQRPQPEAVVACGDAGVGDKRDDLSGLFTEPSSAPAAFVVMPRQRSQLVERTRGVAHGFGEPRDHVVVREHAPARRTKPCRAGVSKQVEPRLQLCRSRQLLDGGRLLRLIVIDLVPEPSHGVHRGVGEAREGWERRDRCGLELLRERAGVGERVTEVGVRPRGLRVGEHLGREAANGAGIEQRGLEQSALFLGESLTHSVVGRGQEATGLRR